MRVADRRRRSPSRAIFIDFADLAAVRRSSSECWLGVLAGPVIRTELRREVAIVHFEQFRDHDIQSQPQRTERFGFGCKVGNIVASATRTEASESHVALTKVDFA